MGPTRTLRHGTASQGAPAAYPCDRTYSWVSANSCAGVLRTPPPLPRLLPPPGPPASAMRGCRREAAATLAAGAGRRVGRCDGPPPGLCQAAVGGAGAAGTKAEERRRKRIVPTAGVTEWGRMGAKKVWGGRDGGRRGRVGIVEASAGVQSGGPGMSGSAVREKEEVRQECTSKRICRTVGLGGQRSKVAPRTEKTFP